MSENRRRFLRRARDLVGTFAGGLLASNARADDTLRPGTLGAPVTGYGARSEFERSARWVNPARYPMSTGSCTPLGELDGVVTPSALHYERHHAGVPGIDPAAHRVLVHGLVQRPLEFTMDALRRFPSATRLCFLECSGNSWREWPAAAGENVQQTHGLTSCSEWTGVLLKDVLAECGVEADARWIVAEGGDGARLTRSVPLAKCQDDVLLAYAQNGEALRPEQGYPVRLLVPGYEGSISVKWLTRIKVTDTAYYSREETSKYTDLMPDGRARAFTWLMDAKSVITLPSPRPHALLRGFNEIRGLAWSGRGRITRVEVSVDDGAHWQEATLHGPVLPVCHTRFTLPWRWDGAATIISSRCHDETGYVQPTREALVAARGTHSFYHYNGIQRWRIAADGSVHNV